MSRERRLVVGASDRERTAVITVAIPAGGEVEIDPTWRFVGWRDEVTLNPYRSARDGVWRQFAGVWEEGFAAALAVSTDAAALPREALERVGYYYGQTYIDDPITPRWCWLKSDGAGSSVPVTDDVLELIELLAAKPLIHDEPVEP